MAPIAHRPSRRRFLPAQERCLALLTACCLLLPVLWPGQAGGQIVGPVPGVTIPPIDSGVVHRPVALVELVCLDSTIHLDIRYATERNFMGRRMYAQARAFLQRPAAEALVRVQRELRGKGYGLLVFDAYRPWSVTRKFWNATPPEKRIYVANPRKGSRHNRGCAVDLTLYDRRTGRELEMTSAYDDFTERAAALYPGGTAEQRALRDLLRMAMRRQGFRVNPDEWWHFDHRDWQLYPVLDIPFEKL